MAIHGGMAITQDNQKTSLSQQISTKCQTMCKARIFKTKIKTLRKVAMGEGGKKKNQKKIKYVLSGILHTKEKWNKD